MKATPESVWKIMFEYCDTVRKFLGKSDLVFKLDDKRKNEYISRFKETYDFILAKFMDNSSDKLDRHKQAAIAIYVLLENPLVEKEDSIDLLDLKKWENENNRFFIGNEIIALSAGMQLLKELLNYELKESSKKSQIKCARIENIFMPIPYYCDTPYFEVVCRNLYFERKYISKYFLSGGKCNTAEESDRFWLKKSLFILEFSNTLFLLEQLTLRINDIDPACLKRSKNGSFST